MTFCINFIHPGSTKSQCLPVLPRLQPGKSKIGNPEPLEVPKRKWCKQKREKNILLVVKNHDESQYCNDFHLRFAEFKALIVIFTVSRSCWIESTMRCHSCRCTYLYFLHLVPTVWFPANDVRFRGCDVGMDDDGTSFWCSQVQTSTLLNMNREGGDQVSGYDVLIELKGLKRGDVRKSHVDHWHVLKPTWRGGRTQREVEMWKETRSNLDPFRISMLFLKELGRVRVKWSTHEFPWFPNSFKTCIMELWRKWETSLILKFKHALKCLDFFNVSLSSRVWLCKVLLQSGLLSFWGLEEFFPKSGPRLPYQQINLPQDINLKLRLVAFFRGWSHHSQLPNGFKASFFQGFPMVFRINSPAVFWGNSSFGLWKGLLKGLAPASQPSAMVSRLGPWRSSPPFGWIYVWR